MDVRSSFFISTVLLTHGWICSTKLCQNDTNCGEHGLCNDTGKEIQCICSEGYKGDGYNCTDIDECAGNNECHSASECTNTGGSYACTCTPGYTGNGSNCLDINECESLLCDTCVNKSPGFYCDCDEGFIGFFNVKSYENGKYEMTVYGYEYGDCSPLPYSNCTYSSRQCSCTNDPLSYDRFCMEVDRCISNQHNCHDNATCIVSSNSNYSCQCEDGFVGDGRDCSDVDECESASPPCKNCTNTIGGYSCGCDKGYDGNLCIDVDECSDGTHNCHPQAVCTNTVGSYFCTCKDDYNSNGDNGTWCSGCPEDSWSRWVDSDLGYFTAGNLGRASGLGDFELSKKIRNRFPDLKICEEPTNMEARLMNGKPYLDGGERVHMAVDGFYCLNSEQGDGECHNYYVRFCCPESESDLKTVTPKPTEESSGFAIVENKRLPFFNTTNSEIVSKHKCATSQITIQWTKSQFLSGYFYKLHIQDLVTMNIKETSVQVVLKKNPSVQITGSTDSCAATSKLSVSKTDSIVIHVVAKRLDEQIKIFAKVIYRFGEKSRELTFVDFA